MKYNLITKPEHYELDRTISPIDVLTNWKLSYHAGNMLKYLARWRKKGGLEDLEKLRWYARHRRSVWDKQTAQDLRFHISNFPMITNRRSIALIDVSKDWKLVDWEEDILTEIYFIDSQETQSNCDTIIQIITDQLTDA